MQKYLKCKKCRKMVSIIKDSAIPAMCCGEKMEELIPGEIEASLEKHIPMYEIKGNVVDVWVGNVIHPMVPEHFIEWISIETKKGSQIKKIKPNTEPKASFILTDDDSLIAVYEYCNLHGLWINKHE